MPRPTSLVICVAHTCVYIWPNPQGDPTPALCHRILPSRPCPPPHSVTQVEWDLETRPHRQQREIEHFFGGGGVVYCALRIWHLHVHSLELQWRVHVMSAHGSWDLRQTAACSSEAHTVPLLLNWVIGSIFWWLCKAKVQDCICSVHGIKFWMLNTAA